ncbi:phage tail assembly protein [Edwardsiella ictaluri]|uniref:phage tail assembly protein n=1 Tax=Edwardsiella ictaluri TaxID=67780 RepID=UPI000314E22D|nr:phage tail assembly protein [Edwardsiella ictaluri]AVZ83523.1 phage tail assembly protein [Edwardsiella ictaluri]EKS7764786.1 phage tail assembly protein [Edwardsiella ictaluri]EKS7771644.1 phage tail assembly protein [Edwardsiella ictaluri]EKS7774824.1 phage tail assembly protein [Edwardsiella ictaluri]EKS7778081.1 phage tail assembly protein [Edwardsiella ictaluri]
MTTPFTHQHTLRWPIEGIAVVTVSTHTIGEMRALRKRFCMDDPDEAKQDRHGFSAAVFMLHTELSDAQRGELAHPDLTSITLLIHELVMTPSDQLSANARGESPDTFPLLVPVTDAMRQGPITHLHMMPPTVRLTDSVRELAGFERERELVATCTGVMPETVDKLHMPDWLALQQRLSDFLTETADYFPQVTSNG